MGKVIYLTEQSKLADVNTLINTLYSSVLSQGKSKKGLYLKIINYVYFKYKHLQCLAGFNSFSDFKKTISHARRKKQKQVKNVLYFYKNLTQDQFFDRFNKKQNSDYISRGAWENFFENKRMLELTGHEDDW